MATREELLKEHERMKEQHAAQRTLYKRRRPFQPPLTGDIIELTDESGAVIGLFCNSTKKNDKRVGRQLSELLQRHGFTKVGQIKEGGTSFVYHYSTPLPEVPPPAVEVNRQSVGQWARIIEEQTPRGQGS